MEAVKFDEANKIYKAPKGQEDKCYDLHTWHGKELNLGYVVVISKWKLSPEEIEEVNKTGHIYLQVAGSMHPMVQIFAKNPFVVIKSFEYCKTKFDYEVLSNWLLIQMEECESINDEYEALSQRFVLVAAKLAEFKEET